jgi:predicted RNA binding protein YcfA (HicA-like mRNA interferase family)
MARFSLDLFSSEQQGSQGLWRRPDGRPATIPIHAGRDIGPPLAFKILRQLSASLAEFENMR